MELGVGVDKPTRKTFIFTLQRKNMTNELSVNNIFNEWDQSSEDSLGQTVTNLVTVLKENPMTISEEDAYQIGVMMHACSRDQRYDIWKSLQTNTDNLFATHPFIEDLMVATAMEQDTSSLVPLTIEEKRSREAAMAEENKNRLSEAEVEEEENCCGCGGCDCNDTDSTQ